MSDVYEMKRIVERKIGNKVGNQFRPFYIEWNTVEPCECTWEPLENLPECEQIKYCKNGKLRQSYKKRTAATRARQRAAKKKKAEFTPVPYREENYAEIPALGTPTVEMGSYTDRTTGEEVLERRFLEERRSPNITLLLNTYYTNEVRFFPFGEKEANEKEACRWLMMVNVKKPYFIGNKEMDPSGNISSYPYDIRPFCKMFPTFSSEVDQSTKEIQHYDHIDIMRIAHLLNNKNQHGYEYDRTRKCYAMSPNITNAQIQQTLTYLWEHALTLPDFGINDGVKHWLKVLIAAYSWELTSMCGIHYNEVVPHLHKVCDDCLVPFWSTSFNTREEKKSLRIEI